jgi:hypothetical protein
MLLTTSPAFVLAGARGRAVTVRDTTRALRRAFPHARPAARIGRARIYALGAGLLAAETHGSVAYLGVYDRHALRTKRAVTGYLRRSG